MGDDLSITEPSGPADMDGLAAILVAAFCGVPAERRAYLDRVGTEHIRVAKAGGHLVGGLVVHPLGQWFGGRCLPMGGVAAVATAPHCRGQGVAGALMRHALREMRGRGVPLSALYPASVALYRRYGYEIAGVRYTASVTPQDVPGGEHGLPLEPIEAEHAPAVERLQRDWATGQNGNLSRSPALWHRVQDWFGAPTRGFLLGPASAPEGYVYYDQKRRGDTHNQRLLVTDWAAVTPRAMLRLLTLFADHRTLVREVTWSTGPVDPLVMLLPEKARLELELFWMLRLVDVEAALAARGYPVGLQGELTLAVTDALLPENSGVYRLTVEGGRGRVRRVAGESGADGSAAMDGGAVVVDSGSLAALYSGHRSARALQSIGRLSGAVDGVELANQVFAGPVPWMRDLF